MSRLTYIEDPGHGWLAVPLADYPDAVKSATGYGYLSADGKTIYLEEDCEMPHFLARHPEIRDLEPVYVQNFDRNMRHNTRSKEMTRT